MKNQAGFSALELMLVLGVIAVALGVAIRTMSSNTNRQNTNQMVGDITTIVSNVKNAYNTVNNGYTALTTTTAIQAQLIPSNLRITNGGTIIQNQFAGGTVTVEHVSDGSAFIISYLGVPSVICNSVITALGANMFVNVSVNTTTIYNITTQPTLDATAIVKGCSLSNNLISWTSN